MEVKIKDIKVRAHKETVVVVCPECQHPNFYHINPQGTYQAVRDCRNCPVVLEFTVEIINAGNKEVT